MHPFQFLASSLRNTTFRRQLSIMVGAGVLLLVLLSSLAISWQSSREIRLNREQQGQRLADSLARQSRLALLSDTGDNVADAMAGALAFPDVQQLEIRRPDGRALVAQSATGAALTLPAEAVPAGVLGAKDAFLEAQDSQAWHFVAAVRTAGNTSPFEAEVTQGQLLGYVRVVLSKTSMQQAMVSLFALNMGISFFFALVFLAATRWITLRMTRPLGQLADSMGRAEQGQAGVRAALAGPRDIVDMAHAFNSMMTVLDEREHSLRQAREEALQLARLKADFAATMSHELRTPLNGVVGTLDILRASALPPAARSYVNLAWDSSQYLLDLINNILDFSSLDAGKLRLAEGDFDLARLCEQSIDLVSPQVGSKGLEMAYMLAPGVPLNLHGDSRRLRQILLNLLGNAVKFTERGDIAIRVAPVGDFAHSGTLRFEVVDSGMGVPVAAQATIFDSYTQADPSSTRSHDGSGLGLAICKQLCVLMGGEIGVESEPGVGSTFWFTLPLKAGAQPAVPPQGRQRTGRVLVLDESVVVRQFLEQSLLACGYACHAVSHAQDAAHTLQQAMQAGTPYQLLIVDMLLAQAHAALVQDLRTAPQFGRPRMVLMNRYGAVCEPDAPQADAYLAKPLRLERLLECLDTAIGAWTAAVALPQDDACVPRILVVEDNRTSQTIATGMLQLLGCQAQVVANGRAAVHAFEQGHWDVILMDCNMPEMDGYEATAVIRTLEKVSARRVPIVAMTANAQAADVAKCLSAGMDDHLSKPLTLTSLRARLMRWLPELALVAPLPVVVDAPASRQGECVDAVALVRLREALGGTIRLAIEPFLEDMPMYLDKLDAAAAADQSTAMRYAAHAVKGAAGNFGAAGLTEVARDIEALAEAAQVDAAASLLGRLRAEYALVKLALERELEAEATVVLPLLDAGAARVLIVDDDRSTRSTLRVALQRSGFEVSEACDGSEVADAVKRQRPDVILMDALMPVMDGFTACALLQETPQGREIPVLMITALEDSASIERAFAVGASDYIPKPLHLAVVNQRVRRLVEATRAEHHVRHLAYSDSLTGLPNRTLFNDHLNRCIERAGPTGQSLALLYLDLDRFKFVNDSLGHETGDKLLKALSERIRGCVRGSDCVARLGGDEFAIVIDDLPHVNIAATTAQKICHAVKAPFEIDGHDMMVSASIGIAVFPGDGADASALLRRADTAMYRAKKKSSCFQFYEEGMEATAVDHLRFEGALRHALERHEFAVFFQPIADAAQRRVVGMEALVRWRHPVRGLVSPLEFIPLAEETGLIIPIGEWVLRTACQQLKAWHDAGWADLYVTVNLSGLQLQQTNIVETLRSALQETGLNPACLTLEITESMLMEHVEATLLTLKGLKACGVSLAIDDFGTGYSSLSYLRRFPVDVLKIDRAFVRDMTDNADDASIVQGIIALAHSLRLKVVAEGVETAEQHGFLARLDCDLFRAGLRAPWFCPAPFRQ
jgi:diguanylate cyclase (GGDEF)-like protein